MGKFLWGIAGLEALLHPDEILGLFTLGGKDSIGSEIRSMRHKTLHGMGDLETMEHRLKKLVGKQHFTTKKGLVGIATAPIEQGDILGVVLSSPAYFILREVKRGDGQARHQMVAQAVLGVTKDKMKDVFAGLKACQFEIV
ncbi:hypothetical protein GQX73_g5003 [Xylaria multiplex]|uniref:Uncharacterized protein n=1 Tax=Xylaria multiplex TaxID=323545 RepID=A0A7C8IP14_9PEZI|nr:hypothetical protein GQX73_g5003 [Xylaria multiplex]